MDIAEFTHVLSDESEKTEEVRRRAFSLHDSVGQKYGGRLPYGHHLQMVADMVMKYGHLVCDSPDDVVPMVFGAYFHDSIEDARQSYNDVHRCALSVGMSESQAFMAAEIVYALTNEKGRTRQERQSGKYYRGIRETPYAPFVKMADRMANITFSCSSSDEQNLRMRGVYTGEMEEFLTNIKVLSDDRRFSVPEVMVERILSILEDNY